MNPNTSYNDIDRRMKYLIDRPASNHLLAHISHQASLVIPCHHLHENYKSPIPPLPTFVSLLAKRSCARTGTLLASLVLLDRLRQRLAQFARGMPCTCQRIFLATLIVTTKILHDTSPKNKHWTKYAVYFTLPEINLMEKQLLALMNYQLVISEKDMYYSFITYDSTVGLQLPPIVPHHDRSYIPKSASFNTSYCCQPVLSSMVLQQQKQQYYRHANATTSTASNARRSSNRKRLNISTSSSSSSLSSMEDLIVTPTTTDMYYNNKNNKYSNHNLIYPMKIDPY
ncbi:cyclin [Mucor lusitanicus]|uniref:Cyclin n=2 Tax=Mucor circinelloides f. lusitanicus TaxID=29924 RepID=A0A168IS39_MUCCL|nr:cyclin [Mucor lusitanicus]OAD00288.1 cyclin [Mucor lusitanicus CBS 277.49]